MFSMKSFKLSVLLTFLVAIKYLTQVTKRKKVYYGSLYRPQLITVGNSRSLKWLVMSLELERRDECLSQAYFWRMLHIIQDPSLWIGTSKSRFVFPF